MSDLKLFRLDDGVAVELAAKTFTLEKYLQQLIERNMETLFGANQG
ncbi:hypothetical protein [Actinomadura roseirufa]|nr:hypothetical protein [Actinomadura roseirufa]